MQKWLPLRGDWVLLNQGSLRFQILQILKTKELSISLKNRQLYRDKKVVISGGGDSALDWAIFLSDIASEVTLNPQKK